MVFFARERANPDEYLPPAPQERAALAAVPHSAGMITSTHRDLGDIQNRVDDVIASVEARGFVFEPWQVASFITAVRTKPFVILAGISGTGKTKLPRLVADATGACCRTIPVRPDWTDSSDLLGFQRLDGSFQPGNLLRFAKIAQGEPDKQFFFVLDEMNIARVEYYLAEVLSRLEERYVRSNGRISSDPLMPEAGEEWGSVVLPENLCIVGSVNMDETTYGFSKKVLDRAFVIEFSNVDLSAKCRLMNSLSLDLPSQATSSILCNRIEKQKTPFIVYAQSSSIGAVIARLQDLIVTSGLTSMLRVLHDPIRHSEQSETLASFGFQYAFRTTLMVRDILSKALPSADQRIIAAETRREYDAAISVMQEVFGGTRELTEFFNPFASAQLFVALTERGVAVSAGAIWPCEKVAGLHNVATLPLFRNRGYAHAVVIEALRFARSNGFHYAGLRAMAALVPYNERVGFEIAGYLDHDRYDVVVHEK